MTNHPTRSELEALVIGGLDADRLRSVFRHLFDGCKQCRQELLSLIEGWSQAWEASSELPSDQDEAYEAAFDRAFAVALDAQKRIIDEAMDLLARRGPVGLIKGPTRVRGLPACEALLRASSKLGHEEPHKAVELAKWATIVVGRLSPGHLDTEALADLRCRAWFTLGNAYRVADNHAAAEAALTEAFNFFVRGSRNELLLAQLISYQASLWADQRRFGAAIESLGVAYAVYVAHGDEHLAGRILIKKGLFTGYSDEPERAIDLIKEGLKKIDSQREPDLVLWATHNLALFMVEDGRFREARTLAKQNLWRFEEKEHRIDLLKLRWVEARANAGLGLLERAERGFVEVQEGMLEVGKRYHSALAALDLSLIYLRQNRLEETRTTVLAAAEVFLDLEISREAIGAVLVLQNAYRKGLEAGALLERAVDFLRRLERDPALTFKSWFL